MLAATLADVRKRIERAGSKGLNEQNTRATLVEPVLSELGWDVRDVDEVAREFKLRSRDKPVDFALLTMGEPKLFLETKALGGNLDDRRWASQIMGYAAVAGVEWIVLTNGDEYRLYNAGATVPVDQKLLRTVTVSGNLAEAAEILALISKSQLQTNRLAAMWKAHFVDRRVKAALQRFFTPDHDLALLNHLRAAEPELSTEDIRASLRRCKLTLTFPLSPDDLPAAVPSKRTKKSSKPDRKESLGGGVSLRDLIESGLLRAPSDLVRRYRGRELKVRLLANGTIEFGGKTYLSPSQAGSAARATVTGLRENGKLRATNGWTFWNAIGPGTQSVSLDELRQAFARRRRGPNSEQA